MGQTDAQRVALLMSYLGDEGSRAGLLGAVTSIDYPAATLYIDHVDYPGGLDEYEAAAALPLTFLWDGWPVNGMETQPATWNFLWERASSAEHPYGRTDLPKPKYAAIFNADDRWEPGGIAALVAALEANPRATVAYGDFWLEKQDLPGRPRSDKNVMPPYAPVDESPVPGPFAMFRVEAAKRVEIVPGAIFDESLRRCADWNLWIRLRDLGPFVLAEGRVGVFAYRQASLSHADPAAFREEMEKVRTWARARRTAY